MVGNPSDLNEVFEVLSEERRREALRVILEQETSVTLADLADEVAVRENQAPLSEISAEEIKGIYLDLYHTHVPKLSETGAITYHPNGDTVSPTGTIGHVVSYLNVIDGHGSVTDPCTR